MSTNQTTTATLLKGIGQQKDRTQESNEHRDERLRLQRERSRAAREQHVVRYRAQDQERQQTSRALTRVFFSLVLQSSIPLRHRIPV
ncbi:hypothetical protein CEXT_673021 [Caerostris extrusa]|uniref:Uncharacterized protein n=1 Tax=Caerostris extrusa TaxID=172846 RepID=A0AAV4MPA4_CAEEX|nr:hypothetical protein CEXT_673021 [Caerostris extrusa]